MHLCILVGTVSRNELRPKMFCLITPQIKDEVICFFIYLKSLWNVVLDFDIKLEFWFRNGWLTCKTKIKVDTHEIPFFISSNISSSDWHQWWVAYSSNSAFQTQFFTQHSWNMFNRDISKLKNSQFYLRGCHERFLLQNPLHPLLGLIQNLLLLLLQDPGFFFPGAGLDIPWAS